MVQLSPDTITGGVKGPGYSYEGDNGPGYSYEQTTIEGFSFTHMSGVGYYGDFGNLQVMPSIGPMKLDSGRVDHPGEGWRSTYSHANEHAEATLMLSAGELWNPGRTHSYSSRGYPPFHLSADRDGARSIESGAPYRGHLHTSVCEGGRGTCDRGLDALSGGRRRLG